MGEYAEAALWAERNGLEFCDMGPEDWIEFYNEYDDGDMVDCPICGNHFSSVDDVLVHCRDVHKKRKHQAAITEFAEIYGRDFQRDANEAENG